MSASAKAKRAANGERIHWLDNLRTSVIFLVVLVHAGGVYESSGIWGSFWIVDDPSTNDFSGILFLVMDIFMMPTLFFVSGFLAPQSMSERTAWAFLRSKFKRLMVPWAIAVLTLLPLYKAIFLYSRNLPQEEWTTYFHWTNGIWGQNWLWFLPVLFSFNVLYLALARSMPRGPGLSLRGALLGTLALGVTYSIAMDALGLRGWTKTIVLDFQNERVLIYFLAFLLGARCCRLGVFDGAPGRRMLYISVNAFAWIPVTLYVFFLLHPWFRPGHSIVSPAIDRVILWGNFHVSMLCLGYVMVETFRRYQDKDGRLRKELNENSYYVYILHVVVLGGIASAMLGAAIPSLLKHAILAASTVVAGNMIVSVFRRRRAGLPATAAVRARNAVEGDSRIADGRLK